MTVGLIKIYFDLVILSNLVKTFLYQLTKNSYFDNIITTKHSPTTSGYGGIGRRVRFRFLWPQGRASSNLVIRTILRQS